MTALTKSDMYDLMARHGVTGGLAQCMVAGAFVESGWVTDRRGDAGHSIGLFQLHDRGLGAGLSAEEREQPDVQMRVMVPEYTREYTRWAQVLPEGPDLCSLVCGYAEKPFHYEDANSPARKAYARAWPLAAPDPPAPEEPTRPVYNPDTPPERQLQDWTCSVRTATWMLKSIGGDLSAADVQDLMVLGGIVSPEVGLLQGDGSALAAFLAQQSGCPTGHAWIDWDWLTAHAGTMPIGIGSPSLYHWVAVRGMNADGSVAIMNPAPTYKDLGDELTETEFQRWKPWAAVWIEVGPAEGEDMARIAELETIIGEMQRVATEEVIPNIEKALGYPLPDEAQAALASGALPAAQTIARAGAPA